MVPRNAKKKLRMECLYQAYLQPTYDLDESREIAKDKG